MRALIFLAGAVLLLGGCDSNDQAETTANADESLTAQNIVANDITAIDAVTADAANMAEDVDINFTNEQIFEPGNGTGPAPAPASRPRSASRSADGAAPRARPSPPQRAATPADNATE